MPRLREILLKSRSRLSLMYKVESVCRRQGILFVNNQLDLEKKIIYFFLFHLGMGEWFILYQLGKNIDPLIFKEFIGELYKSVEAPDIE